MRIGPTLIDDTYAEAFAASYTRLVVTAADAYWLDQALGALCGYGTSVLGCDCEIAVEQHVAARQMPDLRPGASVLAFAFTAEKLAPAIANRVGQTLLTSPTVALFDRLVEAEHPLPMGDHLRFFGDGHEEPTETGWSIPTMEGPVLLPSTVGTARGVAGGNLILQGDDPTQVLAAARRATEGVAPLMGVITPFPGGVCRSGSKVGSRYDGLIASTNEVFCPTLRPRVASQLVEGATCAYEIIFNGMAERNVRRAMYTAIHAAAGEGLLAITAGNYGGKLGKIRIPLRDVAF